MTADTLTSLSNFMNDMIAPLQEAFPTRTVLLDELRRNTRRSNFVGRQVRVPILAAPKQGTGAHAETGGPNVARQLVPKQAFITMARVDHPIEISLDLLNAAKGNQWVVAGNALKLEMDQAETALARVENELLWGNGTGLVAAVTAAGTTTTTVTVGTSANFYQLYPGRVGDFLNRSTGATVSLGRSIVSNNPTAGTIVIDSAISTATTDGFYLEGSFGTVPQGLQQPFATSGTFEGIDLATNVFFRGTDGRGGVTTPADLSMAIMDGAYRRVLGTSGEAPDFWVGDPAAIDKFGQGLVSQFRWEPKIVRLNTGWEGIDYRGTPLIPDFDAPTGVLLGLNKKAVTIYGYAQGPEWDEETGSKFQRFSRNYPVEAWLIDFFQLGVHNPAALVRIGNLNQAT